MSAISQGRRDNAGDLSSTVLEKEDFTETENDSTLPANC